MTDPLYIYVTARPCCLWLHVGKLFSKLLFGLLWVRVICDEVKSSLPNGVFLSADWSPSSTNPLLSTFRSLLRPRGGDYFILASQTNMVRSTFPNMLSGYVIFVPGSLMKSVRCVGPTESEDIAPFHWCTCPRR